MTIAQRGYSVVSLGDYRRIRRYVRRELTRKRPDVTEGQMRDAVAYVWSTLETAHAEFRRGEEGS